MVALLGPGMGNRRRRLWWCPISGILALVNVWALTGVKVVAQRYAGGEALR